MYNIGMKTITTTNARKQIAQLINAVRDTGDVFAIGRRNRPEVLLIKFPAEYNSELNDITNVNTYSESFSFLENEPETYSVNDLKKQYV
jgi:PHD/YefM family antitoxin component YafN of YafNO toxin-antitoxin module